MERNALDLDILNWENTSFEDNILKFIHPSEIFFFFVIIQKE